jgi:hypothetical protein
MCCTFLQIVIKRLAAGTSLQATVAMVYQQFQGKELEKVRMEEKFRI